MNPFSWLYASCNNGDPADKLAALPNFPRIIDVEVTSACNMRCRFCPTGLNATGRDTGFMEASTWEKIINDASPFGTGIRIIGWGEPLLHEGIAEFVAYATRKGVLTHINTNGTKITRPLADRLIRAGLSSIKVSLQGTGGESYQKMRGADFFSGAISALQTLHDARGANQLPYIQASTSITTESPAAIKAFIRKAAIWVDEITLGKTTFDFIDKSLIPASRLDDFEWCADDQTVARAHPDPCPEVFDKVSIHWDGTGAVCCNAYGKEGEMRNVNDVGVIGLWRDPVIEAYRKRLANRVYEGKLCESCWDYAGLTKGGRENRGEV